MIVVVPYDPGWPRLFASESRLLARGLGALALRIEHVGSTAVPGLAAKPVIDIQVSVPSFERRAWLAEALQALGYGHIDLGDFDRVYPFFAKPQAWPSTHHVHLCVAGSAEEWRHLAFRDALRGDRELAARYAALKEGLARRHGGETLASREAYSLAKSGFVAEVLRHAQDAPGTRPGIRASRMARGRS